MIKPGEKVSGVRWRWVLIAGAGAGALTFALLYLTINVYAAVLSLLSRVDVARPPRRQRDGYRCKTSGWNERSQKGAYRATRRWRPAVSSDASVSWPRCDL